jgi:hypothetical protein
MTMDAATRAAQQAKLAEVRREIHQLEKEQATLNEYASGAEGNRHAAIDAQLTMLRNVEVTLRGPLLDALEDDNKNSPD